ncbi:Zinc finger C2H2 [Penicillium alfredii]|uniref:Zinc finger C2H2 n=1 Tax=Penicillium alfredii TaxID=1506179 RepID=A0A9W9KFG6_9EURO|nr:Zinc finger C2H2 [Penicillium alfredii]KAJ5104520.1 Zinc finger C2H2 [Penicillium alfredii]
MLKRSRSPSRSPSLEPESRSTSSISLGTVTSPERAKILHRDPDPVSEVMHCSLPPHRETLSFGSYEDYEVHYLQAHANRCSECSRNFPTGHLLSLHIEETHDALMMARRARGEKTYGCFIETCERKCSTPQKRKLHLIDKHMFPRTYNFWIVNDGIDRQTSLLRPLNSHRRRLSTTSSAQEGRLRRRSSAAQSNPPATASQPSEPPSEASNEMDIDQLEQSMSALRFVPASVTRNQTRVPRSQT